MGGGGARGSIPLKGKNVGVESPPYRRITSEAGWVFSPTKSKTAFTLAEVLITLGIIGVVAAMTMPTLIKKHQQQVMVTRLQKNYSIMAQAVTRSTLDNGDVKEWDLGTDYTKENLKRVVDKYFVPYFKKIKIVETTGTNSYQNYGFILADGAKVMFSLDGDSNGGNPPSSINISFDFKNISQISKRDFSRNNFFLHIEPYKNKLEFFHWGNTRNEIINNSNYGCRASNTKDRRYNCGALIQMDGWKISDDYPW